VSLFENKPTPPYTYGLGNLPGPRRLLRFLTPFEQCRSDS
jgi:hypothetical protein